MGRLILLHKTEISEKIREHFSDGNLGETLRTSVLKRVKMKITEKFKQFVLIQGHACIQKFRIKYVPAVSL